MKQNKKTWKEFIDVLNNCSGLSSEHLKACMKKANLFVIGEIPWRVPTADEIVEAGSAWMERHGEDWIECCFPSVSSIEFVAFIVASGLKDNLDCMIQEGFFYDESPYLKQYDLFEFETIYHPSKKDIYQQAVFDTAKAYDKFMYLVANFMILQGKTKELMENLELEEDEDSND